MILYFSGTGNSEYVAKRIADMLQNTLFSINRSIKEQSKDKIESMEPLVFVTPTYAWRIPRVVEKWIENTEFEGNKKAYFVMTCGTDNGNAEKYIQKLCSKKGFEYMGCVEMVMPENYITLFRAPDKDEAIRIIKRAEPLIEQTARAVKEQKVIADKKMKISDHLQSGLVNDVFYPMFVSAKKFYATDDCVGCGVCVKKCPLNNIELVDGKPKWGENCTQCMACICDCPKEAIEYGNRAKGKERYHFPWGRSEL